MFQNRALQWHFCDLNVQVDTDMMFDEFIIQLGQYLQSLERHGNIAFNYLLLMKLIYGEQHVLI